MRCPQPLWGESVPSCERLGTYREKLLRRTAELGAGQVRTRDLHRTAQGGGRGWLQGVREAGGSALPAGKAAEEQVSPTLAVIHPGCHPPQPAQVCGGRLSHQHPRNLSSLYFQLSSFSQHDFQLTFNLKSKM